MEKVKVKASSSNYVPIILTPKDTFSIFNMLPLLQQTMVLLDAVTGLRFSEIAGLRWSDVDWENKEIHIQRRWIRNNVDEPKTMASKAPVAMPDFLAAYLQEWRRQTTYAKAEDWIFASVRKKGASPRVGNMLVRDCLYPAAVQAGVLTESRMHTAWIDRKTGKTVEVRRPSILTERASG
jgi:integrase